MGNRSYSPPNIIIVDDVNANLALLSELIRNAGYIARPFTSASQAMNAIEALIPHLILLDVSMPEIDGFLFCSMLKKNANTRDIPVIFISGLNSSEEKIKGLKLGAVDYITKPFNTEEVSLRIDVHLKNVRMRQELENNNKRLYKLINEQIHKIYDGHKTVVQALLIPSCMKNNEQIKYYERLSNNSRILALSLQLSSKYKDQITNSFIDVIEMASQLHDIGMTLLENEGLNILMKTEKAAEHTIVGAMALEKIYALGENNEFIKMAIDIAKYHHEKWDGSGYPFGLAGEDIPLSARIVAIISTYNAYNTWKDNSDEFSYESHLAGVMRIQKGCGTQFDPYMVEVFIKIQNQFIR